MRTTHKRTKQKYYVHKTVAADTTEETRSKLKESPDKRKKGQGMREQTSKGERHEQPT